MKSILVPLEDETSEAQLETALLAARAFGSHMDGLAPRSVTEVYFYGEGLSPAALEQWDQEEDSRVTRAEAAFREFVEKRDVPWGDPDPPSDAPTAGWIGDVSRGDAIVGQLARLYDLTVLAHPISNVSARRYILLETVLFESGRPIMVGPAETPKSLGKCIVIAWNGSTESARALAFASPFLQTADEVHVLTVENGMVAGPDGSQVQESLRRSGIAAHVHMAEQAGRSTGEAILEESAKLGADLLVKGAYTHSRLRQMIFGGATSHILSEAKVPVLMAH